MSKVDKRPNAKFLCTSNKLGMPLFDSFPLTRNHRSSFQNGALRSNTTGDRGGVGPRFLINLDVGLDRGNVKTHSRYKRTVRFRGRWYCHHSRNNIHPDVQHGLIAMVPGCAVLRKRTLAGDDREENEHGSDFQQPIKRR